MSYSSHIAKMMVLIGRAFAVKQLHEQLFSFIYSSVNDLHSVKIVKESVLHRVEQIKPLRILRRNDLFKK